MVGQGFNIKKYRPRQMPGGGFFRAARKFPSGDCNQMKIFAFPLSLPGPMDLFLKDAHRFGGNMIRSELIQKIAEENPHLIQRDVDRIVSTIFDEVIDAMARGERVELRGFGAFSVKKRDSRTGRNPRTGESVPVEEKHVPFFKTGKLLRDRLNGDA